MEYSNNFVQLFLKNKNISKRKDIYSLSLDEFFLLLYKHTIIVNEGGIFFNKSTFNNLYFIKYKSFIGGDEFDCKISENDYVMLSNHCEAVIAEKIQRQINSELNK